MLLVAIVDLLMFPLVINECIDILTAIDLRYPLVHIMDAFVTFFNAGVLFDRLMD